MDTITEEKQRSISVLARKYVGMKIVVSYAAFWRKIEEEKNNSCPFHDISLYAFCNTFSARMKKQWEKSRGGDGGGKCMKIKD